MSERAARSAAGRAAPSYAGRVPGLRVVPVPDPGLGNTAYLVDLGDGRGLAVDAGRDLRALRSAARTAGLSIAYAADTHLHADYLSGAVQLAAEDGATVLASRAGRREFPHRGLVDDDELDLGGLVLRALATPGHTDEHLAYLLLDAGRTAAVFTGGSLLVGAAARTDLVSPDRTEELARAQYRSLRRLAALPAETVLCPTHGGGSFCAAAVHGPGATSTIGAELATNPLLGEPDEDRFVHALLARNGSFPPYFLRLGEANRRGPRPLARPPSLPPIAADSVARMVADGAVVVDTRPLPAYAACHPAGALSIALRPAFASWLGWLAPPDRPLVVVRDAGQDPAEIAWQAAKIGYDNLEGEVEGGLDGWRSAGLPVTATPLVPPGAAGDARLVDVRQRAEYDAGHVPGAEHLELGSVAGRAAELVDRPVVLMCGHGERAMSAASVLERAGAREIAVVAGGPADWP